jgi:YfiH family protein
MAIDRLLHKFLDQNGLRYGFFTRNGGVSESPFHSLNCSLTVNDKKNNVQENLRLISNELQLDKIIKLNQTHSSNVHTVINSKDDNKSINADGLVTNLDGIGLSVLGADCAPILFYDKESKTIGACHAGWRGAINNIVETTISSMENIGAKRNNIISIIGPTIQKYSYIVKDDVAEFVKKTPFYQTNNSVLLTISKGEYYFDLPLLLKESLILAKVKKIGDINIDTYQSSHLFFSHRRTSHEKLSILPLTGRQISVIGMLKD